MVHIGARAVGGAGLIMAEATAVSPEGRISSGCAGLWNDQQTAALAPIVAFQKKFGAVPGMQIAHSGRKGSAETALNGGSHIDNDSGGWDTLAPTNAPFDPDGTRLWKTPIAMTETDIIRVQDEFVASARRALDAGYELLEVHGAHGYLLHSFCSPLVNTRADEYGGDAKKRARMMLETVEKVRAVWPEHLVLAARLSAEDFVEGGLTIEDTAQLAGWLSERGVDIIDCSGGGATPDARGAIGDKTATQPDLARQMRKLSGVATMAVGAVRTARQAEQIIEDEYADIVLLGREMLRDPHWPYHAANELNVETAGVLGQPYDFFVGSAP